MSPGMELEIITSTQVAVKTSIKEIYIPAFYGEAGILEHHLPYIALLESGEVAYKDLQGVIHYLFIENGFVKNENDKILIVSDRVQKEEDMDHSEIESEYVAVTGKIQSASRGEITAEELAEALEKQRILKIKVDILKKSRQK
jgi:ATP synthase F1 epsilon subunit